MSASVDTQAYIDALIDALAGVYSGETIPVLEGPAERILLVYDETYPVFISVFDETMDFEPMDGYTFLSNTIALRIEIFVMAAPSAQDDTATRRARAISDSVIAWLMGRTISIPIGSAYRGADLHPVRRERILEESVIDGHYAITAEMTVSEVSTCP